MTRVIRVVITGSECTGKTTLAKALAEHYSARRVQKSGRGSRIAFSDRTGWHL